MQHPDILLGQAFLLRYKPVNLDVLPLFVVLMLAAPLILWGLVRRPHWTLSASALLYVVARWFDWNFPSFPSGSWYFNPLAWQLMFVFGAWVALGGGLKLLPLIQSRLVMVLAVAWLVFAFLLVMTWHVPSWGRFVPYWLSTALYPIDKTNMDPVRVAHFLALLILIARFIPRNSANLSKPALRPLILCGQNSLPVFCLGVLLSFTAHWILVQIASGVVAQVLVSCAGISLLCAAAWLLNLYKRVPDIYEVPGPSEPEPGVASRPAMKMNPA